MNFEALNQADISALIKLPDDKKSQDPKLQKIDTLFFDRATGIGSIDLYRVLDGVNPKIPAQLYDDLLLDNFSEEELESKTDFQAYFAKQPARDARRENLHVVAVQNGKYVGAITGMAFHKSQLGYVGYFVVDQAVRSMGIGSKLFQTWKTLLKSVAQQHGYDHDNLAMMLQVEKPDSIMNLDKDQDPRRRLAFYHRQNCRRVSDLPCYIPVNCDWFIAGVNRNFKSGEKVMERATALQLTADYLDTLECFDGGDAVYTLVERTLGNEIRAENLFPAQKKLKNLYSQQNHNSELTR